MGFFKQKMDGKTVAWIGLAKKAKHHPREHGTDKLHHLVLNNVHVHNHDLIAFGEPALRCGARPGPWPESRVGPRSACPAGGRLCRRNAYSRRSSSALNRVTICEQ